MTNWGTDPLGATPIDEEQKAGLRPSWITTRDDLNQAEADNILKARRQWLRRVRPTARNRMTPADMLDELVVRNLHRDMYSDVWRWAGTYRQRDTNIGVPWHQVPVATKDLVEDAKLWLAGSDPLPVDEAACRFHHRLVQIHPFPNGNGRHSREMSDLLLRAADRDPFTWGQTNLVNMSATRERYIDGLRTADQGDIRPLLAFVRT